MVIVIKHNGYPFRNNENAVLLATGITHHIVLLLKQGLYAGIPEISVSPAPVPPRAHPGR